MRVRDLIDTPISVEDDAKRRFNGTFSPLALAEASAFSLFAKAWIRRT